MKRDGADREKEERLQQYKSPAEKSSRTKPNTQDSLVFFFLVFDITITGAPLICLLTSPFSYLPPPQHRSLCAKPLSKFKPLPHAKNTLQQEKSETLVYFSSSSSRL